MAAITLNLPDSITSELVRASRETRLTPEAVAEDMIRRMIALRRFDRLREEVRAGLNGQAPATEDDILNEIS